MGRLSKEEKARRAAEAAKLEATMREIEAKKEQNIAKMTPHLNKINSILDNIDLGSYSKKWCSRLSNHFIRDNAIHVGSTEFGGVYPNDNFYRISVTYNSVTEKFEVSVSQCRMGNLNEADLERLISETNQIKQFIGKINEATNKVIDYANANGFKLA